MCNLVRSILSNLFEYKSNYKHDVAEKINVDGKKRKQLTVKGKDGLMILRKVAAHKERGILTEKRIL